MPSTASTNNIIKRIAMWGAVQRTNRRKHKLSVEQIKKLSDLSGWFW